ncbi:DUF943 family protein [Pluralibacter gergoviae]|nr:DUF943 family protein [Pluralibacter gergoviae]ELW9442022.1 DUF943 family protein [Pluralibacter gergoviae]
MCKNRIKIPLVFFTLFICFIVFKLLTPVKVIAVYLDGSYADVLVKNFPLTDRAKIKWWQENDSMLKEHYNVPAPSKDGVFHISFWAFDNNYKPEGKEDLLCFNQIKSEARCIEKNKLMEVKKNKNGEVSILTDDAYILSEDNMFTKKR